jgi:hypothetical protein
MIGETGQKACKASFILQAFHSTKSLEQAEAGPMKARR